MNRRPPSALPFERALLGEGWTAKAYLVNDELVFKFPKRPEEWQELDREIAFLDYAGPLFRCRCQITCVRSATPQDLRTALLYTATCWEIGSTWTT